MFVSVFTVLGTGLHKSRSSNFLQPATFPRIIDLRRLMLSLSLWSNLSHTPTCLSKHIVRITTFLNHLLANWFQRIGRTDANTLAAKYAGGISHSIAHKSTDPGGKATTIKCQGESILGILCTNLDAAPAVNTVVIISNIKRVVIIRWRFTPFSI